MEDWQVVERLLSILGAMNDEGAVYGDRADTWFGIRWRALEYDWIMVITVGRRGGLQGAEFVIDQSQRALADKLLAEEGFHRHRCIFGS